MKKIFILGLFIIMGIGLIFPVYVLEVRVDATDELVYQQLAKLGDEFHVTWIHSVTLQPVIETYKLEKPGKIPIVQMIFDDNGPNLPAHPEFNQRWIIKNGKFIVVNYERVFERVPVTIGAVISDHVLVYNGQTIHLKDIYRPGGYVHIGLQKNNITQFLLKEVEIWLKNI